MLSEVVAGIAPAFATPDCDEGVGSSVSLPKLSEPNEPPEMVGVTPPPVTADGIARPLVVEELPGIPGCGVLPKVVPELGTTGGTGAGGPFSP